MIKLAPNKPAGETAKDPFSCALKVFDPMPAIYRREEALFHRPIGILLLSHIIVEKVYNRVELAERFWEYCESQEIRLKNLSDTLRLLRKLDGVIKDHADHLEVYPALESDLDTFIDGSSSENYALAVSVFKAPFLQGFESKTQLMWDRRPELYDWMMNKRDELSLMHIDNTLKLAAIAATNNDHSYGDTLWQAYSAVDKQLLTHEDIGHFISLFKVARDKRFQKIERDAESDASVSYPLPLLSNNLPHIPYQVIDRERDIAAVDKLLRSSVYRIVTIIGPAGIGKSSLALEFARKSLGKQFCQDGIYWLRVDHVHYTNDLFSTIRQQLDLPLSQGVQPLEYLRQQIQDRAILLVLDSAEHLSDLHLPLESLLQRCPNVKFLVTSQTRIGSAWEVCYWLEGLRYPGPVELDALTLDDLYTDDYSAMRLFVQSAERIGKADFEAHDVPHIARICQALGGFPLSINLVASWRLSHSCKEIAQELLSMYGVQMNPSTSLQKRVIAPLEQSWTLLKPDEQKALRSLSVFSDEFALESALWITGVDRDDLNTFVEKSFLTKVGLLSFKPLVRRFCYDKLSDYPEEKAQLEERHAHYFLDDTPEKFRTLSAHHIDLLRRNTFKACFWALKKNDTDLLARMVNIIRRDDFILGTDETKSFLDSLGQGLPESYSPLIHMIKQTFYIRYDYSGGKLHKAAATAADLLAYIAAHGLIQKFDSESGEVSQLEQFIIDIYTTTCNMVGWTYLLIGEYAKSEQVFMEMFKYPTTLKATAQASAAYAQCYQGKMVEALENVRASLKLIEVGGLSWNRVWALVTLGYVEWQIGDYRAAIVRLENLIDDYGSEDAFRRPLTAARTYLAEALLANGQFDQATTWTERTLELMNTEMWEEMYYESMIIKACIALERGDDEGAGAHFQRALRGACDIENHFLFCRALIGLYDIMRRQQTPDAAILGVFLQDRRHEVTMRDKQWLHRLSQAWPEFRDPVVRPVNSAAEIVRLIEVSGLVEEDSPVQTNVTVDKSR